MSCEHLHAVEIQRLNVDEARAALAQLVELLRDVVHDGASVGFLRPLADDVAERYWREVLRDVSDGSKMLFVAIREGAIVGSAQLALCMRPNGLHRAEVQKLLVHTRARRRHVGTALMAAIDCEARAARRTLLVLDTEPGKPAETMYTRLGWTRVGEIPDFARSPEGEMRGTAFFYRRLDGP
jgi:GNAT superfamily N-acetyltransferase